MTRVYVGFGEFGGKSRRKGGHRWVIMTYTDVNGNVDEQKGLREVIVLRQLPTKIPFAFLALEVSMSRIWIEEVWRKTME